MRVGWVGLGKLGLPIAEEIAKTHAVLGYDVEPRPSGRLNQAFRLADLDGADLIFVAVQTPHGAEYEGVTRLPDTRADFDYSHLTAAVVQLAMATTTRPPLVIVSTVLPGTIEREILPLWDGPVVYNPFFIAMGEEVADFLHPEFVLMGTHPSEWLASNPGIHTLTDLYTSLGLFRDGWHPPILVRTYREAEVAKMAYNTFIGLKIAFANTIGELSHRLDIDSDQVISVLKSGNRRIISEAYLDAGMGDGGPCHPRDNIALSWLARETGMSFDLFGAIMEQREAHTDWLARLAEMYASERFNGEQLPLTVLGKAYKPDTTLQTGSPALLLAEMLREKQSERVVDFDHEDDPA